MRPNKLKAIWASGGVAVNGWVQIRDSYATEVMAHQGWDSMTLDMQHGYIDISTAVSLMQAISTTDVVPVVRVPQLDPAVIMLALDAGAYGIICPLINNRAQARAFVEACRYPPEGGRSVGPLRAQLYGGSDYVARANEAVVTIAMIETAEAVANLAEILQTPGLDAIYVGPSDLSIAHGYPPTADIESGPMFELIGRILASAQACGVVAGLHNFSAEFATKAAQRGFQFITVGSDARFIGLGAKAAVDYVHAHIERT